MAQENEILDTCLIAGRIMVESGSEMYRVEDTMRRMAANAGAMNSQIFSTPTGLLMALPTQDAVQIQQVTMRTINLEKVDRVNDLSRQFAEHQVTLKQLHQRLTMLDHDVPFFPVWLQIMAAALVSCTLMIIYGGVWADFIQSAVVGAVGYAVFYFIREHLAVSFLSEFMAAFTIGFLAWVLVHWHFGQSLDMIIIGAVMPLVPGVAITNAVRDMLAGHLLSGIARGMEALFSVGAIGIGIALIFRFFS
ncbi:threonine/serine exporter family protein [Loigolactobacillus zhaoyuanensis]|uniref:Threonine/serine exporter family protein n=1 Tax=Loigolactobacillus zhaoyuanensis TaxID=2486017 RepID=A0ABW8UG26_9LACO|nr:threonine/serine exporter family protein [Loigolactobacillus zhaoyuanensis]